MPGGAGLRCEHVWEMYTGILPRQVLTLNMKKLHSGGPKEVQNGVAGKAPMYSWPPNASLRHVVEMLRVQHFGDFKELSNEILMSFDTVYLKSYTQSKFRYLRFL